MFKKTSFVILAVLFFATTASAAYWRPMPMPNYYQPNYYPKWWRPTPAPTVMPTPAPTIKPTVMPTPTPTVQPPVINNKMWGAFLSDGNVSGFESQVGKPMDMRAVFYAWGDSFPTNSDKNKTTVVFWEPNGYSLNSISSGAADSVIKQFATQAKNYGGPVVLIPFEEMNGNWDAWGGSYGSNTPSQVVSAYKRVHDVVDSVGGSNIKMGWDVNNGSVPDTQANSIANYWPGANYVDYVCVDGFNFGNPWQTYSDVFSPALSQVKNYGKPILIASTASAAGSQKPQWITDALNKIYQDPSVSGFIWFNENKEQNWLVNSDPQSLQAFKAGIQQY